MSCVLYLSEDIVRAVCREGMKLRNEIDMCLCYSIEGCALPHFLRIETSFTPGSSISAEK
jgi:hypothetical protein